jgi:uncharacterized protein
MRLIFRPVIGRSSWKTNRPVMARQWGSPLYESADQINAGRNSSMKDGMPNPERKQNGAPPTIGCAFSSDDFRLQGTLHLPEQTRPNLIVGSHGLYSSGDSPKQVALADACGRMGIAYFRFDHRGCGRSEGRFEAVTSLEGRRRDLVEAVAFLRAEFPLGSGLGLFGSSFGGATCLAAAPLLKPNRMVTLAAPLDSRSILAAHEADPPVAPPFRDGARQFDLRANLRSVDNLLVIHGDDDTVIPASHARLIYNGAGEPKKLLTIPGGDHRLSRKDHQQRFMAAALDWFRPLISL